MSFFVVIGLEVHAQLLTKSKMFCACPAACADEPNTQVCPICLGHPGSLPSINSQAVSMGLRVALALGCRVNQRSAFARKNYFYPDLPKGFQISQHEHPLAEGGSLQIEDAGKSVSIGITRVHLEEDSGKSLHFAAQNDISLIDFNRSGIPLAEIVSEPKITSPEQAYAFLRRLKQTLVYIGVSSGRLEQGSMRCDANISLQPKDDVKSGTRVEIKNLNSIRNVERALRYEIARQTLLLESGVRVVKETRLFDSSSGETVPMRDKEESHDYRYFPEPDLIALSVGQGLVEAIRASMPELPAARKDRFMRDFSLSEKDADILVDDTGLAEYFDRLSALSKDGAAASKWVLGELLRCTKEMGCGAEDFPVRPKSLAELMSMVASDSVSSTMAKELFAKMIETGRGAAELASEGGYSQLSDESELRRLASEAIAEWPDAAGEFRCGRERALGFLVGKVMAKSSGKANPKLVSGLLVELLKGGGP